MGFEWGERNNLTFSYLVALRRVKKRHGVEKLTDLSRAQWDEVASEADGLALAMTKPNKMSYQTGATGVLFQFMSFQHRAALTLLGMNPKLSKGDVGRIWLSGLTLWGANLFGAEEWVDEWLAEKGLSDWGTIPIGDGINVRDVLVSGFIESGLNDIINMVNEENSDINFGIMAPGAAISQLYQGIYDLLTAKPTELELLGPSANQISGFGKGFMFFLQPQPHWSTAEKIARSAQFLARETLPMFNDIEKSIIALQTGEWVQKDGDKLGIQAHATEIAFRLGFGLRPDSELSLYRARELFWTNQENINNWVKKCREYLKISVPEWFNGNLTDKEIYEAVQVMHTWTEGAPEGIRHEIFRRIMSEPGGEDGKSITQMVAENATKPTAVWGKMAALVEDDTSVTQSQREDLREMVEFLQNNAAATDQTYRDFNQSVLEQRGLE
jgi:hypothetical protein